MAYWLICVMVYSTEPGKEELVVACVPSVWVDDAGMAMFASRFGGE